MEPANDVTIYVVGLLLAIMVSIIILTLVFAIHDRKKLMNSLYKNEYWDILILEAKKLRMKFVTEVSHKDRDYIVFGYGKAPASHQPLTDVSLGRTSHKYRYLVFLNKSDKTTFMSLPASNSANPCGCVLSSFNKKKSKELGETLFNLFWSRAI